MRNRLAGDRRVALAPAAPTKLQRQPQPQHVEGLFVNDVLFLRDPATSVVYSSKRRANGDLRRIGRWDEVAQSIVPEAPVTKVQPCCATHRSHATGRSAVRIAMPAPTVHVQLRGHACCSLRAACARQHRVLQERRPDAGAAQAAPEPPAAPARVRPRMPGDLAFECDSEDHCETGPAAYRDVKPLLNQIARQLGKEPADLLIYDPYFCAGSAVRHLQELGFPHVYNRCAPLGAIAGQKR
jgi:hypothetical protein